MPAKILNAARTVAEIDAKLPRTFFVRRGHIRDAFGLTEEEMTALVGAGIFRTQYLPPNKRKRKGGHMTKQSRAVFVRGQVMQVAQQWEGAA